MTPERKAEVNRCLAEFEDQRDILDGNVVVWGMPIKAPDYTADLNVLARLEAKLPPLSWEIFRYPHAVEACLEIGGFGVEREGITEAEARAEAICQYLERKNEASV